MSRANLRSTVALTAGRQFVSASCAPPPPSAAVTLVVDSIRARSFMKTTLALVGLAVLLTGCASAPKDAAIVDDPANLPTLQAKFADRLAKLKTGMPLDEFRQILPEAYPSGQNGAMTAYELADNAKYVTRGDMAIQTWAIGFGSPQARVQRQVLWFYFHKDQLVQWGRPQDWPKDPDLILEQRIR